MPRDHKPPAFLFYPDDFASDSKVEAMTTEEVGCYILLLCKAWRETPPCTLPDDNRLLARWARVSEESWLAVRSSVLSAFSACDDGRIVQKRLRSEYDKQRRKSKARSDSGRLGAAARWHCHNNGNGNAMAKESENETTPRKKKKRYAPGSATIPAALDVPAFREAWASWLAYKTEVRKPYKTERGEQSALSRLAEWGPERAVAAIKYSIGQEYQGIYEEGGKRTESSLPARTQRTLEAGRAFLEGTS